MSCGQRMFNDNFCQWKYSLAFFVLTFGLNFVKLLLVVLVMSLGKIVAIILIFQRLYRRCYHCHLWRSLRLGFIFRRSVETDESLTCSCDWFLLVWTCQKSFNPCTSWMASFRLHSALTLRAYFIMKYSFPLHRSISLSISRLSRLILLKSHPIAEVLA